MFPSRQGGRRSLPRHYGDDYSYRGSNSDHSGLPGMEREGNLASSRFQ